MDTELNDINKIGIDKNKKISSQGKISKLFYKFFEEIRYIARNRGLLSIAFPGLLHIFIFSYLPMIGIIVAFKNYRYADGIFGSEWVGFKNFSYLFTSDVAWIITRNSILYSLTFMIITTILGIIFAIMLTELTRKWVKIHQTILFFPHFLSWVVVGYLVLALLDHSDGFINNLLTTFGFDSIRWYYESKYWPHILNIVNLWKGVGIATLIYYAGIMGIDPALYEAARMDGANKFKMATKITIPMISPLISIMILLAIGAMMKNDFGLFYFIPRDSGFLYATTDVIDTYVYRSLRVVGDIGMASAAGVYQSIVGLILVISANFFVRKINRDNSLW